MQATTEVPTDVPSGFEPNNPERVNTWRARMAKLDAWLVRVDEIIAFDNDNNDPEEGSRR